MKPYCVEEFEADIKWWVANGGIHKEDIRDNVLELLSREPTEELKALIIAEKL